MEHVLLLDHLRDIIFNQLHIKDLMSLDQVSWTARRSLKNYRYNKPVYFRLEKILLLEKSTGPQTPWTDSFKDWNQAQSTKLSYYSSRSDISHFPVTVPFLRRGPLLAQVCLKFDLKKTLELIGNKKKTIPANAFHQLRSLCVLLSDQVITMRISIDLSDQEINKDLLKRTDLAPQLLQVFRTFSTQTFSRCTNLHLKIKHDIRCSYFGFNGTGHLQPLVRELLIGLDNWSAGGFLSKFPALVKLTLAGSHAPPLLAEQADRKNLELQIQELTLLPKSNWRDVLLAEDSQLPGPNPLTLNFASLRKLTIHAQDVCAFGLYGDSQGLAWQAASNWTTRIDLLESFGTCSPSPLALQHLTLTQLADYYFTPQRKLIKILLTENPLKCPALHTIDLFRDQSELEGNENHVESVYEQFMYFVAEIIRDFPSWTVTDENVGWYESIGGARRESARQLMDNVVGRPVTGPLARPSWVGPVAVEPPVSEYDSKPSTHGWIRLSRQI